MFQENIKEGVQCSNYICLKEQLFSLQLFKWKLLECHLFVRATVTTKTI